MEDKYAVATVGIAGLSALGTMCLYKGIDGNVLMAIGGIIGTIVGYAFGHKTNK